MPIILRRSPRPLYFGTNELYSPGQIISNPERKVRVRAFAHPNPMRAYEQAVRKAYSASSPTPLVIYRVEPVEGFEPGKVTKSVAVEPGQFRVVSKSWSRPMEEQLNVMKRLTVGIEPRIRRLAIMQVGKENAPPLWVPIKTHETGGIPPEDWVRPDI